MFTFKKLADARHVAKTNYPPRVVVKLAAGEYGVCAASTARRLKLKVLPGEMFKFNVRVGGMWMNSYRILKNSKRFDHVFLTRTRQFAVVIEHDDPHWTSPEMDRIVRAVDEMGVRGEVQFKRVK